MPYRPTVPRDNTSTPTCSNCSSTPTLVFVCNSNGIGVTDAAVVTSVVSFQVGFLVESNDFSNEWLAAVEKLLVETAVVSTLQCETKEAAMDPGWDRGKVTATSTQIDQCSPSRHSWSCTVWRSSFEIAVARELDPSVASFLGYMSLRRGMENGLFLNEVPALERMVYLSPKQLLSPITDTSSPVPGSSSVDGGLSVNRWTFAGVLVMCKLHMGLLLSTVVMALLLIHLAFLRSQALVERQRSQSGSATGAHGTSAICN